MPTPPSTQASLPPLHAFKAHGDALSCAGQISVADVALLAAAGYRSIICNRPDAEDGAVDHLLIAKAASKLGMAFAYQPVLFSQVGVSDGTSFAQTLVELPKPILAYCRTGRRSAALWALAKAPHIGVGAALASSSESGFDLDELRPRMQAAGLR